MPPKRTPSNPRGPQRQNSTRDKKNPNNRKDPEDKILKIELNNGIKIPLLGLGTWKWQTYTASGMNNTERAVEFALENGYRHIDTDERYNNLVEIGRGLDAYLTKQARDNDRPVTRENLFLSCKLWGVSFKNVEESYNRICKQLGTTYLDCLYLRGEVKHLGKTISKKICT